MTHTMTQQGHVLERENRLGAGQEVTSVGPQGVAPMLEGQERFAAYMAHELRTPLATQRALLELALPIPTREPLHAAADDEHAGRLRDPVHEGGRSE